MAFQIAFPRHSSEPHEYQFGAEERMTGIRLTLPEFCQRNNDLLQYCRY